MTPAFAISSLNLPIAVSSSVPGITPASVSLPAFTITMNRIVTLRLKRDQRPDLRTVPHAGSVHMTNGVLPDRHSRRNYFASDCGRNGDYALPGHIGSPE